jgi:hypothetical protein
LFADASARTEPIVTTGAAVAGDGAGTFTVSGLITSDGGSQITARGVVYGLLSEPTLTSANASPAGAGTGVFSSTLTGLAPETTYYARAYATSTVGTSYGADITFKTASLTGPRFGVKTATFATDPITIIGEGEKVLLTINFATTSTAYVVAGVHFYSPNDHARQFYSNIPITGNKVVVPISLNQWAASGEWRIAEITTYDANGTFSVEYENQLKAKGVDTRLTVVNNSGDNVIPDAAELSAFQAISNPGEFGDIIISVKFRDSGSGLSSIGLQIAPEGKNVKYFGSVSGSELLDGTATFRLSKSVLMAYGISTESGQSDGIWTVLEISAYDNAGNFRVYYANELSSLGFPTRFEFGTF